MGKFVTDVVLILMPLESVTDVVLFMSYIIANQIKLN